MPQLLYQRIILQGTVNEPEGKPEPQFALPSTVNWMHALKLVASENITSFRDIYNQYISGRHSVRPRTDLEINSIYEQLLLSLNHLSALSVLRSLDNKSDVARIGIMTWYYGVYNAASAMICSRTGGIQETHEKTAREWQSQIATNGLALKPFDANITSLVENIFSPQVETYKNGNNFPLTRKPENYSDAVGALGAYISGTAKWYKWKKEEEIKQSKAFRDAGFQNFRTKAARKMRDDALNSRKIAFLHQAFRYRGKANYREALFLAYGANTNTILAEYLDECFEVLAAFIKMASAYSAVSLGRERWNEFLSDIALNRAFSFDPNEILENT